MEQADAITRLKGFTSSYAQTPRQIMWFPLYPIQLLAATPSANHPKNMSNASTKHLKNIPKHSQHVPKTFVKLRQNIPKTSEHRKNNPKTFLKQHKATSTTKKNNYKNILDLNRTSETNSGPVMNSICPYVVSFFGSQESGYHLYSTFSTIL